MHRFRVHHVPRGISASVRDVAQDGDAVVSAALSDVAGGGFAVRSRAVALEVCDRPFSGYELASSRRLSGAEGHPGVTAVDRAMLFAGHRRPIQHERGFPGSELPGPINRYATID